MNSPDFYLIGESAIPYQTPWLYSTVILSNPSVSESWSFLTMLLGISDAALSHNTDKVRGQQKPDLRITMSLLSNTGKSQLPRPIIFKKRSATIISILISASSLPMAWRNRWSNWLHPLFDLTPIIQSPLRDSSGSRVISMLFLWKQSTLGWPWKMTSSWTKT